MPEAVIVDAIRTPIGRAAKGSLKDVRTDDLAAIPLKALVERNPGVDFSETVDVMMGCGFQMGEAGYNIGRNAALLAGIDHHVPALTVSRFCASSNVLRTCSARRSLDRISEIRISAFFGISLPTDSPVEGLATSLILSA